MAHSNALRWPVKAPRGTVYLTSLQWALWWYLRRPKSTRRGRVTLEQLSGITGSSRGRVWHALARLRSLELLGWRAWPAMPVDSERKWHGQLVKVRRQSPGCRGHLLVWIPTKTAHAFRDALASRQRTPIDSVSGSYGAYVSARGTRGAVDAWTQRRNPPAASDRRARDGPHRGRPPAVVYARCPAGHSTRLGRTSWIEGPPWDPYLEARFVGACRRCGAGVVESIELRLPAPPPRGPSAGELAEPELRDRRRAAALALLEDPSTPRVLVERIRRDYLEPPADLARPDGSDQVRSGQPAPERWRSPLELETAGGILAGLADGLRARASVKIPSPADREGKGRTRDSLRGGHGETDDRRPDDELGRPPADRRDAGQAERDQQGPVRGDDGRAARPPDREPGARAEEGPET